MAMSATIISSESTVVLPPSSAQESQQSQSTTLDFDIKSQVEVEFVKCDCCGLTEECTPEYIEHVKERYQGHWICGLCAEAIEDEIVRADRVIGTEEAMATHMSFYRTFNSSGPPPNPAIHLISAMRQILRRSVDSPRGVRSSPSSPVKSSGKGLARSGSCFPTLTG